MGFLVMREKELCHEGKCKGRKSFMDFLALFIIGSMLYRGIKSIYAVAYPARKQALNFCAVYCVPFYVNYLYIFFS